MADVFIKKIDVNHLALKNTTGAAVETYDFAVIGPFACVADENIAINAIGGFNVEEGIRLQANELVTGENTFATLGQVVYFDTTTKKFSDTSTAGYYAVGYLTQVKDSAGMIEFEKTRYATVVPEA